MCPPGPLLPLPTSKLIAPFVPFLAESLWQILAGVFGETACESVHLCDYPDHEVAHIDDQLSERMQLVREISSLRLAQPWSLMYS